MKGEKKNLDWETSDIYLPKPKIQWKLENWIAGFPMIERMRKEGACERGDWWWLLERPWNFFVSWYQYWARDPKPQTQSNLTVILILQISRPQIKKLWTTCKVEFNQPSCCLYFVPNLLVFQQLVTLYLGGFVVRVVSEIEYWMLKSVQENRVSQLDLAAASHQK